MSNNLELAFYICALGGGSLFLIRLVLQFFTGFDSIDTDIAEGDLDISDSDVGFKLLSFQGITAFLMMFGLSGRALLLESHVAPVFALAGATFTGFISVWVIGKIFTAMKRLQSTGTFDLSASIGQRGTVYLTIPASGTGKARITANGRLGVFDAISHEEVELGTGAEVEVVRITGDNVLVVKKASDKKSGEE